MGSDSAGRGLKGADVVGDSQKQDAKNPQEVIHWHNRMKNERGQTSISRGVAARALHLSRGVEKPSGRVTYIVVLEGLCRFSVQELSARGTYYVARVNRLDLTKAGFACRRLRKMQPQQPGYSSSRGYLELLADLPWQKVSEEPELDLKAAQESLDQDHYGLVKVKQRIIEYLAVRKVKSLPLSLDMHNTPLFCLLLQRVAVSNPVMLLDEIDKTGSDVRGDPASALLEVLDPEQNKTFNDQYPQLWIYSCY
ncbi:hypothetical protein BHE74_00021085 [Ensete ventricosum]|nr:hypothetical protein BHE74_00021085 [Ensete ventricosum]RZR90471.1 hypothetical protein BHM03_00018358 [Ensete ventricosum]